jgi:hypothetical protein
VRCDTQPSLQSTLSSTLKLLFPTRDSRIVVEAISWSKPLNSHLQYTMPPPPPPPLLLLLPLLMLLLPLLLLLPPPIVLI